jgi:hypothetical protein
MRTTGLLLLTLVLALTGCESNPDPEQACEDTADALARAAVRCDLGKYPEVFGQFVSDVGGCERVIAVRDVDALYDDCFPGIEKLSCPQFQGGELPESCKEQLLITGP